MKEIKIIYFLTLYCLFVSCSKQMDLSITEKGYSKGDLQFKVNVRTDTQIKATTRPKTKNDYTTNFTAGDSFGIFAVASGESLGSSNNVIQNAKVTYNGTIWESEVHWNPNYSALDFYAYYPYNATYVNPMDMNMAVKLNQQQLKDFKESDVMYATKMNVLKGEILELNFAHLFGMFQVEVPLEQRKGYGPDHNLKISINGNYSGKFNLSNQSFKVDANQVEQIQLFRIEQKEDLNYENSFTYRAYLPAQEISKAKIIKMNQGKQWSIVNLQQKIILQSGVVRRIEARSNMDQVAYIPAGIFQMGAPDSDPYAKPNEKPQHWVRLTKGYYMGRYEVTMSQFAEFLNATGVRYGSSDFIMDGKTNNPIFYSDQINSPIWVNNAWVVESGRENHPVTNVFQHGAKLYAEWKGAKLPTEAQWEYACRAGTNTSWFFGENVNLLEQYAWISPSASQKRNVGELLPNPWGLYDMYGNALEITQDTYGAYPTANDPESAIVDPLSTSGTGYFVSRGGPYNGNYTSANSKFRNELDTKGTAYNLGFRIVYPE